ncbi:hypothetical protein A5719_03335 [Mycolicibacterium peregrinum]|uniref:hypothetical protein n=1 Tax=Mycolicibacterium peregrinum TaxID=43304 RepID=UPI0007E9F096|nr:hypothetical protein [Mycolicibacterium peregrinum]OBF42572.1 hypothetical protein A5719_03335 [Mycolicibacterium peregrinum]
MQPTWQTTEPLDPAAWIPLSELALEGLGTGTTIEQRSAHLARELSNDLLHDDIGRACVPRSVARELFAVRAEKQQREAARRANVTVDDTAAQTRERVRALQSREALGDPIADMKRADIESSWDRAAQHRDELATSDRTGNLPYHPIKTREQ